MGVENEEDKVKDIEDVKEDQGERMWLMEKGDKDCSVMPALSGIFIHFYRILQGRAILVVLIKTIKEFNFLYFTWNFILKHFLKG